MTSPTDEPAASRPWTIDEGALWRRIEAHAFENPEHDLTFAQRLARDHGWSIGFARRAIEEYRRFAFLAVVSPTPVTPSEDVDEVWHQHLTYSRDYWEDWCTGALRKPLHHGPTKGGGVEGLRFGRQYAETLALYEAYFGRIDRRFWPSAARRFAKHPRFRVIDRDLVFVLPRPGVVLMRLYRRFRRREQSARAIVRDGYPG